MVLSLALIVLSIASAQVFFPSTQPDQSVNVPSSLMVELNVNKDATGTQMPVYSNGEAMQLVVRPSQDAYLYIFNVANNVLSLVMPNAYTGQEIRVAAGSSYTFPAAGSNFSFSAGPALGVNKVIALASSQPLAVASLSGLRSEAELNSYVAGGASLDAAYFQVGDLAPAMAATPAPTPVVPQAQLQAVSPTPTAAPVASGAGNIASPSSYSSGAPLDSAVSADAYNAAVTGQSYAQNTGATSSGTVYAHSQSVAALGQPLGSANPNAANNIDYSPYYSGYYANLYRDFYRGLITSDELAAQAINLSNAVHAGSTSAIALGSAGTGGNNVAALAASAAASHASGYNWYAQRQLELFSDNSSFHFTQSEKSSEANFHSAADPWTLYSYLDNQLGQQGWIQNWRRDYTNTGLGQDIVIADYVSAQYQTNHISLRVELTKQADGNFKIISSLY
ncbi:MAG: DUF4384 domain-containing protein [Deinococcales bacterium]